MGGATWDDEYLTVHEITEHLKLNQQTVRNWVDQGRLPRSASAVASASGE